MRRGGIQDRISPNEDPITVGTDPEDPVIVKEQLPMPVKPRLRTTCGEAETNIGAKRRNMFEAGRVSQTVH